MYKSVCNPQSRALLGHDYMDCCSPYPPLQDSAVMLKPLCFSGKSTTVSKQRPNLFCLESLHYLKRRTNPKAQDKKKALLFLFFRSNVANPIFYFLSPKGLTRLPFPVFIFLLPPYSLAGQPSCDSSTSLHAPI